MSKKLKPTHLFPVESEEVIEGLETHIRSLNVNIAHIPNLLALLKQAQAQIQAQKAAYAEAKSLATALWRKHYKDESPKWEPYDTTEGILTQIDNMVCGLKKPQATEAELKVGDRVLMIMGKAEGTVAILKDLVPVRWDGCAGISLPEKSDIKRLPKPAPRPAITIDGKEVDYEDLTANEKIAYDLLAKLEGDHE